MNKYIIVMILYYLVPLFKIIVNISSLSYSKKYQEAKIDIYYGFQFILVYIYVFKDSNINMKYRSRTEIVAMILDAANGGTTKTRIMYKAFLSYAQLKEYLSVLVENNLIEYLDGIQVYKTTEKGLKFLKMHSEIGELLPTTIKE